MTYRPSNPFRPKWNRAALLPLIAVAIACGGPSFSTGAPPQDASGEAPGIDEDNTPIIICPPCPSGASDDNGADATVDATTVGDAGDATVETASVPTPPLDGASGVTATMGEHGDEVAVQPRGVDATVDTGISAEASVVPPSSDAAGTLDATSHPALAVGVACEQTSDCSSGLFCVDSVCCVTAACPATDQCHKPGTCQPITGLCTNPVADDGTSCSDGNACTQVDACHGGVCSGSNPVPCNAIDICHSVGTCDPTTGACSTPAVSGANCIAGQPCLAWYPDCDNDGYGDVAASPICSTLSPGTPPCGTGTYMQNNTDCCDSDSRASPAQTGWFTGENFGTADRCGSWDYDCDGREEQQSVDLDQCQSFTCAGSTGTPDNGCAPSPSCTEYVDANPPCGTSDSFRYTFCVPSGGPNAPCTPGASGPIGVVWQVCH